MASSTPGPTPKHDDGAQRGERYPELGLVEPVDGAQLADAEDAQRHVDEHRAQRGQRQVGERPGGGHDERDDERRGDQAGHLRARRPTKSTTALRGGLAFTAKPPTKAASTLPAPTPMKSRSTSVSKPPSSANERVVAEVWVITMSATARALGSRRQTRWADSGGACRPGRPAGRAPIVTTPLAARSNAAEAASDSSTPMSAPGSAAAHALAADDDGEDHDGDRQRVQVGVAQVARDAGELLQGVAPRRGHAQHLGELAGDDRHGDAGEKAGDHRRRQKVGDPAHAGHADRDDQRRRRAARAAPCRRRSAPIR